jgi:hypothetical protein
MTDVVSAMDNGEIGDSDTYIYAFTNKARLSSITGQTVRPHISEPNDSCHSSNQYNKCVGIIKAERVNNTKKHRQVKEVIEDDDSIYPYNCGKIEENIEYK